MTTPRRLHPAAALLFPLLTAAVLAGCGGSSGSGDAAAPAGNAAATISSADGTTPADSGNGDGGDAPDPCSLTTAADLSTAYGIEFGDGAPDDDGPAAARGFKVCTWENAGGTQSFVLQTVATSDDLGQTASDLYDQSVGLYDGSTDGGVGDKSILLADEGGFLAVQGDVFVQGNPIVLGADLPAGSNKAVLEAVVGQL